MRNLLMLAVLVLPFQTPEGWWTCPEGYWIREGRCVPWHEGQDVDFGADWRSDGYDYWALVERQRKEREDQ
jgi:hypothetical protein